MTAATIRSQRPLSFRKRWVFRLLAVLLGFAPFLLWELSLRAVGWQPAVPVGDPFVDFQSVRPLFVPSADGQRMETAQDRLDFFRPESFAAKKGPDEYRIVCLGGSTVQGRPYAIETSFTTWLELGLEAADPAKQWEVINCGGVSYASYRLVPILEEMLRHGPDLIVLYTGHNEFLEDRSYAAIKQTPGFIARTCSGLTRLRSVQMLHRGVSFQLANSRGASFQLANRAGKLEAYPTMLTTEVDALLDYRGGLADYHRDGLWRQSVIRHFEYNLRRMVRLANSADVPILLVDPPANLRDCPPFKVEDTGGISDADRKECERLVAEAKAASATGDQATELLEQAVALNEHHAGLHYHLGVLHAEAGRLEAAKHRLQRASDEDICPLRILEPMNDIIRQLARDTASPLVEVRRRFESLSEGGIPGDNIFVDHVHPTFRGHQLIAEEIMAKLEKLGVVKPRSDWKARRDERFQEHWRSLDLVYFERGRQRLEGLQRWTQGRANKIREDRSSAPESQATVKQWPFHRDLGQPIAQFETVFWDPRDTDTLRPMLQSELHGSGKSVLEIGTGTGFLALYCLKAGAASVVATDINPAAVANARYNANLLGFSDALDVRQVPPDDPGAFSVIEPTERFDLIVSNPPWENHAPSAIDEYALCDPGFHLLDSMLRNLRKHLNPGGKALLAYGSAESIRQIQHLAPQYKLAARVCDDRDLVRLPAVFLPAVVIEVVAEEE